MKRTHIFSLGLMALLACAGMAYGQAPSVISYQGRVLVNGTNFTGTGQFKFALVSPGTNITRLATATAVVNSGFITAINVIDGGAGYSSPPVVTIIGSPGSGAIATAQVSGGAVTGFTVQNPGSGYTSPTVIIAPPPPAFVYGTFWSNDGTSTAGSQPVSAVTLSVQQGLFTVFLGDTNLANMQAVPSTVFTQPDAYLRIWFNDGANGFSQLTPDQRLGSAGYAMMAARVSDNAVGSAALVSNSVTTAKIADAAVSSNKLADASVTALKLATNSVTTDKIVDGTITASDVNASTFATTFWKTDGNSGTTTNHFIGTTDNQALELKVNNVRALRLEPNASSAPNFIVGPSNIIASTRIASVIAGGRNNTNDSSYSVVGGGEGNRVVTSSDYSTIAGGHLNRAQGSHPTIGGGANNLNIGDFGAIAGGWQNTNSRYGGTVSGGTENYNFGQWGVIGGGQFNRALDFYSTIAGGGQNTNDANAGTIGGGVFNLVSGYAATIPGGVSNNAAGQYSFAAGRAARANHDGTFVWADSQNSSFTSTAANQFLVRASGGVGINRINPATALDVNGSVTTSGDVRILEGGSNAFYYGILNVGDLSTSQIYTLNGNGGTIWTSGNDGIGSTLDADSLDGINSASFLRSDTNSVCVGNLSFGVGFQVRADLIGGASAPGYSFNGDADTGIFAPTANTLAVSTGGAERLRISATGNVGIGTNNPTTPLEVTVATGKSLQFRHDGGLVPGINVATTGGNAGVMRFRNAMEIHPSDDLTRAGKLDVRNTNGTATITLNGQNGEVTAVTFTPTSDRNAKENFSSVDTREVLAKVAALPITRWNFKQVPGTEHVGPMAQDFYAAFSVGTDDKHIATVDADGVALAAIQGLHQLVQEKDAKISDLEKRLSDLEKLIRSGK